MIKVLTAVVAILLAATGSPSAERVAQSRPTFDAFVEDLRREARTRGLSEATIESALGGLTAEPVVVSRDRSQPELIQSLDSYVARRITARTIAKAREELRKERVFLAGVEDRYGVPPELMVSIWGLESDFGRFTGSYSTIRSLATLAYDARRPLFRSELFSALEIVERGDANPADLKGSWAGAMGQPQFMPSSFLRYAVDEDGDGRPNIWTSRQDVFASMANYLKDKGWRRDQRWGREVVVSRTAMARIDRNVPMRTDTCRAIRETTEGRPLTEWQKLGVRLPGGHALPSASMEASLVRGQSRHFLVYGNYAALVDYNCSNSYAVTVGLLADRLAK